MSELWEFGDIDTFTTGAVGVPGQRTFFVQVRSGDQRVTVKCEKQQVSALAEYLGRLLTDLPAPDDLPMHETLELVSPQPSFSVGPMGLAYDQELDRFVVMLEELVFDADDDDEDEDEVPLIDREEPDPSRMRVHLTRAQAAAFCARAEQVVAAGRPNCLFCGQPIDPDGHPCPRMN